MDLGIPVTVGQKASSTLRSTLFSTQQYCQLETSANIGFALEDGDRQWILREFMMRFDALRNAFVKMYSMWQEKEGMPFLLPGMLVSCN